MVCVCVCLTPDGHVGALWHVLLSALSGNLHYCKVWNWEAEPDSGCLHPGDHLECCTACSLLLLTFCLLNKPNVSVIQMDAWWGWTGESRKYVFVFNVRTFSLRRPWFLKHDSLLESEGSAKGLDAKCEDCVCDKKHPFVWWKARRRQQSLLVLHQAEGLGVHLCVCACVSACMILQMHVFVWG